jgi:hypothetical protein
VAIPNKLAAALREYRAASIFSADSDYVFCTDSGKPLGWSNVHRDALSAAVKPAKLYSPQPTVHDLRHTFASMLIADGATVEYVRGSSGIPMPLPLSGSTHTSSTRFGLRVNPGEDARSLWKHFGNSASGYIGFQRVRRSGQYGGLPGLFYSR